MRNRERFDHVDDDDLLVVLGRLLSEWHPALLEGDDRFLDWRSRELRRAPPREQDWDAARTKRVRQRLLDRALGERFGVPNGGAAPTMRDARSTRIAHAVEDASQARWAPWTALAAAAGEGRELWDEECDRWVELPDDVEPGRYLALQVAGDSMTPLLHAGDTVLVRLGTDMQRDRIVVARRPDNGYVVKRVGRVERRAIELWSLNPAYEPVRVTRRRDAILGTVVMRWCPHHRDTMPDIRRR